MKQTIFIGEDWTPVENAADAVMVKIIDNDGKITFGIRPGSAGAIQNTFEGHEGRPGLRGGSLPRDSAGASSQDDINRIASEKIERIKSHEPHVTETLTKFANEHNGEMQGLHNRMKTEESLVRKIKSDMAEKGLDAQKAADEINDALRYTMTFEDHKNFTDSVLSVEEKLKADGYSRYDTKYKNMFGPEKVYEGYNTVWVNNDNGDLFELQFHTTDSLRIKSINHTLYKEFRTSEDPAQRAALYSQMINNWKDPSYRRPLNYEKLGKVL